MSNRILKDKRRHVQKVARRSGMPTGMGKTWDKKPCGCVKAKLERAGGVIIRCPQHRGKPSKSGRLLCYWDEGLVHTEEPFNPIKRLRQKRPVAAPDGFVYFALLGGLVKIGHSRKPERRARDLSAELLACFPGGRRDERRTHHEFAALRERGEWFRAEDPLLARIEELRS